MNIIDNMKSSMPKFIDDRQHYDSINTLRSNTTVLMPNGFRVFCEAEQKWYQMSCSNPNDPATYEWTEELTTHTGNADIHVTAEDKTAWNNKADSTELTTHTGNADIHVTAEDKTAWNNKADSTELTAHTGNADIHVTSADKAAWNDALGVHGASAYDIWIAAGNVGTEAEFLASLIGAAGQDGSDGADGRGIVSIAKTGTLDNVDTYTITYTSGASSTFTVTNGSNGTNGTDGQDGTDGITYTPSIGEVTTVDSNELASASVSVNTETKEAVFNFAIPRGNKGIDGVQISDNETVEDKTWSSSKIASEIPTTVAELTDSSSYAKTAEIAKNGTPVGCIFPFAGTNLPAGYLLCNGTSYKKTDYPDLYAAIGNKYGGDTANFNVPNLVDKFIQGSTTSGTIKAAGLPNITGVANHFSEGCVWSGEANGAFNRYAANTSIQIKNVALSGDTNYGYYFSFDASRCSTIYGNSNTVQPPALTMVYIIKAKYIYA